MTSNRVRTIFQECIEGFFSNQAQTYNWTEEWTNYILGVKVSAMFRVAVTFAFEELYPL